MGLGGYQLLYYLGRQRYYTLLSDRHWAIAIIIIINIIELLYIIE